MWQKNLIGLDTSVKQLFIILLATLLYGNIKLD